ncbi:MAG: T9SS type A sorting domain-containing protein [bacterium]
MKTKITTLCIPILIGMIMMFGTSQAQTVYSTVAWDSYTSLPSGSDVPYCVPCDSIKCVPPSGATGVSWSLSLTQHGDTLILPSGFNGNVSCSSSNGTKLLKLRPTTAPVQPTFSTTDTLCGIETKLLDAGNVNQYGFNHYVWTPGGATTQTLTVSNPGTYTGTVINLCGTVNRSIQIWKFNNSKPNLGPDITACQNANVVLNPGTGYSNVVWYPSGAIGATYSPTYSGDVVVTTTNISDGCVDKDTVNVFFVAPSTQDIALVTIDTSNGNNRVTWTPSLGNGSSIKIYRESTTNVYDLVGQAAYLAGSFTDNINSRNQAWRYKISVVDTCGNEGALSSYVQSIHSWVTPTVGGGYTLQWTPYITGSKTISAYNIYYGNTLGQLNYLTYVSGNVTVYSLSGFADSVYVVGADLGAKTASEDALSNWVSQSDAVGISTYSQAQITIKQNENIITITSDAIILSVTVYDLLGQAIVPTTKSSTVTIPTEGIFLVSVMTEKGKITKKVIIQ